MTNLIERHNNEPKAKFGNNKYCESKEWKDALKKAEIEVNHSYTIIYQETDDSLKEAWHFTTEEGLEYVKGQYEKGNKKVIKVVLKELEYGKLLEAYKKPNFN